MPLIVITAGEYEDWMGFLSHQVKAGRTWRGDVYSTFICPPPYEAPLIEVFLPLSYIKKLKLRQELINANHS